MSELKLETKFELKLKTFFDKSIDPKLLDLFIEPWIAKHQDFKEKWCFNSDYLKFSFLSLEEKQSLLILGDSGSGKSSLAQYFTHDLWKSRQENDWIPLFIHLPTIKRKHRQEKLLESFLKIALGNEALDAISHFRKEGRLLLILDGFDEIDFRGNLYLSNSWQDWNQIKVITTCRPEVLRYEFGYRQWFYPSTESSYSVSLAFEEIYLAPFDEAQIQSYCERYVAYRETKQKGNENNENTEEGNEGSNKEDFSYWPHDLHTALKIHFG